MKRIKFKDVWNFQPQNTREMFRYHVLDWSFLLLEIFLLVISICEFFKYLSSDPNTLPGVVFGIFSFLQLFAFPYYLICQYICVKMCYKEREVLENEVE